MLLVLEGWVRRMAGEHQRGEPDKRVEGFLQGAARWLGGMCLSYLFGFQRIRGTAPPSGAELRMQLSAIATLLKAISGQTPEGTSHIQLNPTASNRLQLPEASDLFLHLLQTSLDTFRETASGVAPFELHLVSLYMACVLGQSGMEDYVFPIGILDEPSPPGMIDPLHVARTVFQLQNTIGGWVYQAVPDVSLAPCSLAPFLQVAILLHLWVQWRPLAYLWGCEDFDKHLELYLQRALARVGAVLPRRRPPPRHCRSMLYQLRRGPCITSRVTASLGSRSEVHGSVMHRRRKCAASLRGAGPPLWAAAHEGDDDG